MLRSASHLSDEAASEPWPNGTETAAWPEEAWQSTRVGLVLECWEEADDYSGPCRRIAAVRRRCPMSRRGM